MVLLKRFLDGQCTVITNIASRATNSRLQIVEYVSTTEAAQTLGLAVVNTVMKFYILLAVHHVMFLGK